MDYIRTRLSDNGNLTGPAAVPPHLLVANAAFLADLSWSAIDAASAATIAPTARAAHADPERRE